MTKPMKYSNMVKLLKSAGFTKTQGIGDHEKWTHSKLTRPVVITDTKEISPGVTRIALKAIKEAKEADK